MKIYVHQIPVNGRTHTISHQDTWVQEEIEKALEGTLLECQAEITLCNHNHQVHVEGTIKSKIQISCDICGEDIEIRFDGNINLIYVPANSIKPNLVPKNKKDLDKIQEMLSLKKEDLEVGWYYDGVLDLGVVITEYLLINKDSIVQCKDDNVTRIAEGECLVLPTKGAKNTYNPFAGLDLS